MRRSLIHFFFLLTIVVFSEFLHRSQTLSQTCQTLKINKVQLPYSQPTPFCHLLPPPPSVHANKRTNPIAKKKTHTHRNTPNVCCLVSVMNLSSQSRVASVVFPTLDSPINSILYALCVCMCGCVLYIYVCVCVTANENCNVRWDQPRITYMA